MLRWPMACLPKPGAFTGSQGCACVQEACATVFEYFGAGYASTEGEGVGTYFYATADVLPFGDDFAGGSQHPLSDPSNAGSLSSLELQLSGPQHPSFVSDRVSAAHLQCLLSRRGLIQLLRCSEFYRSSVHKASRTVMHSQIQRPDCRQGMWPS